MPSQPPFFDWQSLNQQSQGQSQQPDFLSQDNLQPLRQFQATYRQDFNPSKFLKASGQRWDSAFDSAKLAANSANTAAQRRAALSGGGINAGFGAAASILPLYAMRNQGMAEDQRFAQSVRGQGSQMGFNVANALSRGQGDNQDAMMRYYLSQRDFNQRGQQFDQSFGLQQGAQNAQRAQAALKALGGGGFNYNVGPTGMPLGYVDAQQMGRANEYSATRNNLIGQLQGPAIGNRNDIGAGQWGASREALRNTY